MNCKMKRLGAAFTRTFQVASAFFLNRTLTSNSSSKLPVVATVSVERKKHQGVPTQEIVGIIQVVMGDLTQEKVDAIVNAANGHLQHRGGVAGAIVRRGGISIQQESDNYIAKHGAVPTGEVAITKAGNLPCKAIIHAVGPIWDGGSKGEEKDLHNAVLNSLKACNQNQFGSVALPAISSGIFGFPKDLCAKILFTVAIDFLSSEENTSLTCVRFTNFDEPTVSVFKRHAQTLANKPGLVVELSENEKSKL
ncbi:uncharacterized protein LOC110236553 [Exaiptasia diaphana]|uniref:Macro domain-containing protein n=1 Tax=Exaiptasia diaphana TaxID=2652724 RepID=A0A913X263_EXADI|nr:uncharacterized protein LOC110236553 [Exaiptasia diaphana]KXJ27279.1 Uncharacterized protein TM-0508 [Exaiptasia diaphana]